MHRQKCKINSIDNCINYLRASFKRDYDPDSPNSKEVQLNCDTVGHKDSLSYTSSSKPHLVILGGEEFLHLDLLDAIFTEFKRLNLFYGFENPWPISLASNGTLFLKKEVLTFIEKWKNMIHISFSIDGSSKTHNIHRKYIDGRGSWEDAIAGYKLVRDIIGPQHCGCVSTYTQETKDYYSEGVIELLKQGFHWVNARFTDITPWPDETTDEVYHMFDPIIDYIIDNKIWNNVLVHQLDLRNAFSADIRYSPHCVSGYYPTLGINGKLYGCHRSATMDNSSSFAHLDGENIVFDNVDFFNHLSELWKERPQKCFHCSAGAHCYTCCAMILERGLSVSEYYETYPVCGWVKGTFKARMTFKDRIAQAETPQDE